MSGSNDAAFRSERILLPKAWDVVSGIMELQKRVVDGEVVEFVVLDFADAFYMLPLRGDERSYFTAQYRGEFFVWMRIAQGSINGPTAFGRLSALTARMTQGLYHASRLQLQVYTDDPCAAIRGRPADIRRMVTVLALFWSLV